MLKSRKSGLIYGMREVLMMKKFDEIQLLRRCGRRRQA